MNRKAVVLAVASTVAATVSLMAFAGKPGTDPTPSSEYKFVGYTVALTNGGATPFGMNSSCQAEFGSEARMATTKEVLQSIIQPSLQATAAWAHPMIVSSEGGYLIDFSGYQIHRTWVSCEGWTFSTIGSNGLSIGPGGVVIHSSCESMLQVSCSAP